MHIHTTRNVESMSFDPSLSIQNMVQPQTARNQEGNSDIYDAIMRG